MGAPSGALILEPVLRLNQARLIQTDSELTAGYSLLLFAQAVYAQAHGIALFQKTGAGFMPIPTPGGVPVDTMSPGIKVTK